MSRLALVTGASSGIGEAFAKRLAEEGWNLVVVARRRDRLEALARRLTGEFGVEVRVVEADLSNSEQVQSLAREAALLPLRLLVNNAALAHYAKFAALPSADAQELIDLNVLAPVLLTRAVLPGMMRRRDGAVINVASLLAFSGSWDAPHLPQRAVYAATKSFLVTFTQIIATELRDTGVRIQVVCPGVVRSEFHSRQGLDMSAVPRMEANDVVRASLHDLERGTVISIPGSNDETVPARIGAAQHDLMGSTRTVELPARYETSRPG